MRRTKQGVKNTGYKYIFSLRHEVVIELEIANGKRGNKREIYKTGGILYNLLHQSPAPNKINTLYQ